MFLIEGLTQDVMMYDIMPYLQSGPMYGKGFCIHTKCTHTKNEFGEWPCHCRYSAKLEVRPSMKIHLERTMFNSLNIHMNFIVENHILTGCQLLSRPTHGSSPLGKPSLSSAIVTRQITKLCEDISLVYGDGDCVIYLSVIQLGVHLGAPDTTIVSTSFQMLPKRTTKMEYTLYIRPYRTWPISGSNGMSIYGQERWTGDVHPVMEICGVHPSIRVTNIVFDQNEKTGGYATHPESRKRKR